MITCRCQKIICTMAQDTISSTFAPQTSTEITTLHSDCRLQLHTSIRPANTLGLAIKNRCRIPQHCWPPEHLRLDYKSPGLSVTTSSTGCTTSAVSTKLQACG